MLAGACPDPNRPRGLRVPLPEGWVATASSAGALRVGPKGRVVLSLERRAGPLPSLSVLDAAIVAEGGAVVEGSSGPEGISIHYRKGERTGLLMVRPLEPGTLVLCASEPDASAAELAIVQTLCLEVRLEAAPP